MATENTEEVDAQFFRVLSDNMKYVFNSPLPSRTQFPTPYSSNLLESGSSSQLQPGQGSTPANQGPVLHRNPDSSFIDRTLNPQLYNNNNNNSAEKASNTKGNMGSDDLQNMNIQPSTALQFSAVESTAIKQSKLHQRPLTNNPATTTNTTTTTNNNNLTVPTGSNNSNNIQQQTDFLLPSPVQLREFLYDSPAGISFFQNTPARSPLRFLNEENTNINNTNSGSSNLMHLFQSVNNGNGNGGNSNNNGNNIDPSLPDLWDKISTNTRTPLRKIDINLMFNNGQLLTNSNSMSPLKKLSMSSLTPYGRRILNDMGTPFNSNNNNNNNNSNIISSNSALIDFQRARKDTTSVVDDIHNNKENNNLDITMRSPKLISTPRRSNKLSQNQIPKLSQTNGLLTRQMSNIDNRLIMDDKDDQGQNILDGSSPTTIQLNSSVTKSLPKLSRHSIDENMNNKIPVLSRDMPLMERNNTSAIVKPTVMDLNLSPTPRSHVNMSPSKNNNNKKNNNLTFLPIPDLPKMGSFKSERSASTLTSNDLSMNTVQPSSTPASRLPSISTFPVSAPIVAISPATANQMTINSPHTSLMPRILGAPTNTTMTRKKPVVKKKRKVTKIKKPKFQIFVSSIQKFNDPNSSVPITSLKTSSMITNLVEDRADLNLNPLSASSKHNIKVKSKKGTKK